MTTPTTSETPLAADKTHPIVRQRKPTPGYVTIIYCGQDEYLDRISLAAVNDGAVLVERGNAVEERNLLQRWKASVDYFCETWLMPRCRRNRSF